MDFTSSSNEIGVAMESLLHRILLRGPSPGVTLFDAFILECQAWYSQPAHTFTEMRTRDNKTIRGDVFEEFCVLYLRHVRGYTQVWRLPDVPETILETLGLGRRDMGIDILCEQGGTYTAVQCKYKTHTGYKSKTIVTWSQLSTFYALCMRTGPWDKYIVMTTCDYVRHMGNKSPKDLSICLRRFRALTQEQWTSMCGLHGEAVGAGRGVLSPEALRAARLARFTAVGPSSSNADGVSHPGAATGAGTGPVADPA
jgi:hypothetical protein